MRTWTIVLAFCFGAAATALAQTASLTPSSTNYSASGGSITLTAAISYPTQPASLGFAITLPTGWSYSGGTNEPPAVKPTVGDTGTIEWAYLDGFGPTSVSFTVNVNYPAGLTGPQTISAEAFYSSPAATLSIAPIMLTGEASPAVVFTSHPENQNLGAGGSATFTATVEGSPAPAFQWQVSADAGATWSDVPGATGATLTLSSVTLALSGRLYRLRAVRDAITAYSNTASLTVTAVAPGARWSTLTQQLTGAGGTLVVSVTFDYPAPPTSLGLEVDLPAGWTYMGGSSEPAVKPTVGDTGTLAWAYFDGFGANASAFSFTVRYPAGEVGNKAISARGFYLSPETTLVVPDLVFAAAASQLSNWRSQFFTSTELGLAHLSSSNADPDGDGLVNLIEYALGLEPKSANAADAPEPTVTTTDWVYTYNRPADRGDLSYSIEVSNNLISWTSVGVTHERISTGTIETWRARYPRTGTTQVFFRLKVSTLQ